MGGTFGEQKLREGTIEFVLTHYLLYERRFPMAVKSRESGAASGELKKDSRTFKFYTIRKMDTSNWRLRNPGIISSGIHFLVSGKVLRKCLARLDPSTRD